MSATARILRASCVLAGILSVHGVARAQFDELLMKVPQYSNALVAIDVDAVEQSPLAIKEHWADKHEQAFTSRPMMLPPEASRLVIAAHLRPEEQLQAMWELAVMDMSEPLSMKSIARAEGGYVDTINGLEAAWTPSDAYFVELSDQELGMMFPANRQYVSRWADYARTNNGVLISDYLRQAAYSVGPAGQIVMAIDLKDMVQPHRIRETLGESPAVTSKMIDIETLVPVLTSLQGVTLNVNVTDTAHGVLRVDFGQDVSALKPIAKPLFLEALDKWGAAIEDFNSWDVTVGDTYVKLEGDLSTGGLRRVFSILEIPTTKFSTLAEQTSGQPPAPGENSDSLMIQSSKAYYSSVSTLIDDLKTSLRDNRDNQSVWMDRYARKIDRLPILNVDQKLLEFGVNVAESFRNMALAKRGANVSAGVRKSGVYKEYQYSGTNYALPGDYYYGYGTSQTTAQVKNQIDRQEQSKALEVRFTEFKEIEDARSTLRVEMTQKYMTEF